MKKRLDNYRDNVIVSSAVMEPTFTCSKLLMETPEKYGKSVGS